MADVEEVGAALRSFVAAQIYPTPPTPGQAGANGAPTDIFCGWPKPERLKEYLGAGGVLVSVYEQPGSGKNTSHAMTDWQVLAPPKIGITAARDGTEFTFSGAPLDTVNVHLTTGYKAYDYQATTSDTPESIAAALAALVSVDQPATANGAVLDIPQASRPRVTFGGRTTMIREIERSLVGFQITIWAPTQPLRVATSKIIEPAIRNIDSVDLPDGTVGMLFWQRQLPTDMAQMQGEYRRDMIVNVDYPITETTDGFQIVSVDVGVQPVSRL